MSKESAGLVLVRSRANGKIEFLLVHPGGPYWKKKDAGAWTIPKGEVLPSETAEQTAVREFQEELGAAAPLRLTALNPVRQKGGKVVRAWLATGDFDPANLRSNSFMLEWPPRSGRQQEFPEVDRAAWFTLEEARLKVNPAQLPLLLEAVQVLASKAGK